ncbi:hypothetical protein FS827_28965, partial [Agrobacterium vitis]|nr:hypothetical protein [Allorhizobium ampelinum]
MSVNHRIWQQLHRICNRSAGRLILSVKRLCNQGSSHIMSRKTFFITGANSGFGLAIATAAA